jgi:DNA-binding IclR family transcriptional regulator
MKMPASKQETPQRERRKTGIQSIEVGVPLLKALVESVGPTTLTALASSAGMPASKAHKYLVSFIRAGLVSQSSSTGLYDFGQFASELGIGVLRRMDVVGLAQEALEDVRDQLQVSTSLAIWGSHGPIVIRRSEDRQVIALWTQLGATLPLLTSASGRVFAAYLERKVTRGLIQAELRLKEGPAAFAGLHTMQEVDTMLEEVRRDGVASVVGLLHVGVTSIGAPIMDHNNYVVGALALVGTVGKVDPSCSGKPANTLRGIASALSRRLGATVSIGKP